MTSQRPPPTPLLFSRRADHHVVVVVVVVVVVCWCIDSGVADGQRDLAGGQNLGLATALSAEGRFLLTRLVPRSASGEGFTFSSRLTDFQMSTGRKRNGEFRHKLSS